MIDEPDKAGKPDKKLEPRRAGQRETIVVGKKGSAK
jgi:hypothetical protein